MKDHRKPFVRILKAGERYTRLLVPGEQSVVLKSGLVELEPQDAIGEHSTGAREEVLVIVEGEARIVCAASDPLSAPAGSLVYIPSETIHNVINHGADLLRYVFIVSPV